MPNYNITIDSRFNPYSFEDYLKPAMLMQEQHNQAADAYATALANSAGLYDALKANAEDAEAAKYVNDYENSLNALASDLATNGLNRTNRRGVYETKAKTGYIEKLKKAIDNRNTFITKQNELAAADPTRRFSDYAYNHGITRFLNPDFTYGSFSEAAIQKQVEDTVKYLAKSTYLRDPNNPQFKHIAGLTKLMQESTGARPEEIDAAMQAIMSGQPLDEKQSKIAQMLYNDAMDIATQHLGNWNWDDDAKQAAYVAASKGLYSALGTEENKIFNVTEPKEFGSSGKTPKIANQLSMRWNTLVFGDNAQERAGVSSSLDFWSNKRMNNLIKTQTEGKFTEDAKNRIYGLSNVGNAWGNGVDGVSDTIELAKNLGLSQETIDKLNVLNDKIQKATDISSRAITLNNGNPAQTVWDSHSTYKPTLEDDKLMKKVYAEFDRRINLADAMTALSFELPATKADIKRTFDNILTSDSAGFTEDGRDKYDGIKVITGFTEDGIPKVNEEKSNSNTRLTKKVADAVKNGGNVQFSAVPVTKKVDGKEATDLYYIMTIDGKHYLVPEGYVPNNLKPDNLDSVENYVKTQRAYDRWSRDVDFNNMTDEQYQQYLLFNNAIGYGNSALGRSAAMALIGPEWGFNVQHINATDTQAQNYLN